MVDSVSINYDHNARNRLADELALTPYLQNAKAYHHAIGGWKACVHAGLVDNFVFGLWVDDNRVHWYICKKLDGWDEDPRAALSDYGLSVRETANELPIQNANTLIMAALIYEECEKLGIKLDGHNTGGINNHSKQEAP